MAKTLFLTMCIDARLKTALNALARTENRTLANLIETEFRKMPHTGEIDQNNSMRQRQVRADRLTMRINGRLKASLERLADEDYRNLTDFVDARLRKVFFAPNPKPIHIDPMAIDKAKPKAARLSTRISAELKAGLQRLANEHHCTLTALIECGLRGIVAGRAKDKRALPQRRVRTSRLTMRIDSRMQARLQTLADEQYRTLTDYMEIELHKIVACRKSRRRPHR